MDPSNITAVITGLDPKIMAAIAALSLVLRSTAWPRWVAVSVPMILGALWGGLTVDWTWLSRAEVFSSILLNTVGGVVSGRAIDIGTEAIRSARQAPPAPPVTPETV